MKICNESFQHKFINILYAYIKYFYIINIILHLSFSKKLYGDHSLYISSCNVVTICKPLESTDGRKHILKILSTELV